MYSPFCMNICQWESCVQSGWRICSQSTKNDSERCLQLFQCNKKEFLRKYTTINETWIYPVSLESNRQSAEWTAVSESRPKRSKRQTFAGKVLALVFWDAQGILFIDYLEKGRTINSEYYIASLVRLKKNSRKWRRRRKKCSFTKTIQCVTSRSQR